MALLMEIVGDVGENRFEKGREIGKYECWWEGQYVLRRMKYTGNKGYVLMQSNITLDSKFCLEIAKRIGHLQDLSYKRGTVVLVRNFEYDDVRGRMGMDPCGSNRGTRQR